jgi:hypothetical protein
MGVAAGVDLAQGVNVDMGVNLRGFHPLMPQHFLDIADVGPPAMHVCGATVAPKVAGTWFVDATAFQKLFDPVSDVSGSEAFAIAGEEES